MIHSGTEFWNHGYYHSMKEFSSSSYEKQYDSIRKTQILMKEIIGYKPCTFGSPHNNSTNTTVRVLRDHFPEIQKYLFMVDGNEGGCNKASQLILRCNYEVKTGVIDKEFFHQQYSRIRKYPYFVLQGHPGFWREEDFRNHQEIVDLLLREGNIILTPAQLEKSNTETYEEPLDLQELRRTLKSKDGFFLYGAGEIGREMYKYLHSFNLTPKAFIVSDGQPIYEQAIFGIPVRHLADVKKEGTQDMLVVLSLLDKIHNTIRKSTELSNCEVWPAVTNTSYMKCVDYIRFVDSEIR